MDKNWSDDARKRYRLNNLDEQKSKFVELLIEFNKKYFLVPKGDFDYYSLLPEGGKWLLLLKDNIEILVIMCSYGVENKDIDYIWIEFDMKKEQLIAEVNKKDGTSTEYVLIPSDEIINHIP